MRVLIPYLKIFHGTFNILVMGLAVYQGWLVLKIRRNRKVSLTPLYKMIVQHRKIGSFLVVLGLLGFFAGITLTYVDQGHLLEYPLHFMFGIFIALSLIGSFLSSKKIGPYHTEWRKIHLKFGLLTILLYWIQVILGIRILF